MKVETFNRIVDLAKQGINPLYHYRAEEIRAKGLKNLVELAEQGEPENELELFRFAEAMIQGVTISIFVDDANKAIDELLSGGEVGSKRHH